jgi:Protein of unknown function (DUF3616)
MIRISRPNLLLLGALAAAQVLVGPTLIDGAWAQSDLWPVKGKLLGKGDKKSKDVSGLACAAANFPRLCLVVDDESQSAQVVIVEDGEIVAGDTIRLIDDVHDGKPLELDGEGVAFADNHFYVVGSHGHPRDKDRNLDPVRDAAKIAASIRASSQVIRVRIEPATVNSDGELAAMLEVKRSAELRMILLAEPALKPFIDKRLDENGLTIEGVAVREGRLYAGLRAPSLDDNRAAVISVDLGALFDGHASDSRLHLLQLGPGRGVRDLAIDGRDILVLAGPSAEEAGEYSVYRWDSGEQTKLLGTLASLPGEGGIPLKPEVILPLDSDDTGLRVLVLFDGAKEGGPRAVRIGN